MIPAPTSTLYFSDLYEGALAYASRFRLSRLQILSNEGRPVAVLQLKGNNYRIDPSTYRTAREPAINLALVRFLRDHVRSRRPR